MTWINGGVKDQATKRRFPTKAALKKALRERPQDVIFDDINARNPILTQPLSDVVTPEVSVTITGPDPYTDRRWYAAVSRRADGGSLQVK